MNGVEWPSAVPAHWDMKRLKYMATYRGSNVDKMMVDGETPVRLCNYTDVYYNDEIGPEMRLMEATATPQEIRRFGLRAGDVVITKDSEDWRDIAVPALVVESADDLVCGYHLAIVRPDGDQLLGRYLLRALQARSVNRQFEVAATGVTRYGLPIRAIGSAWLPLPTPSEQVAIADLLDRETTKLGVLMRKNRMLVERLREKRRALICHTITRGLPADVARQAGFCPNIKRKATRIDWLGDVPEHWSVARLKWTIVRTVAGVWGQRPTGIGDITCVRVADFDRERCRVVDEPTTLRAIDETQRKGRLLQKGDLLIEKSGGGEKQLVGCVVLFDHDYAAVCSNFVARMSLAAGHVPRFWCYVHTALYAGRLNYPAIKQTTGIQNLDLAAYLNTRVGVPPTNEQHAIADFLDSETTRIDALILKVETATARLQEYRAALITAAVDGKIDVRGGSHERAHRG